jgi:hypothetical protein
MTTSILASVAALVLLYPSVVGLLALGRRLDSAGWYP